MQRCIAAELLLISMFSVQTVFSQSQPAIEARPASASQAQAGRAARDYSDEAWRVLAEGLRNKKWSQRSEATKALSLITGNRRAVAFAMRALNDPDFHVRTAAAATLGQLHAVTAIPALKAALSDKEVSVMLAATHALYVLKDPAAYDIYYAVLMGDKKTSAGLIEGQVNRLKDPKQVIEMGFQEGLGFVPYGGMGYEAYRMMRQHNDAPVRAAAARFLALDPDPVTEDALVQTALTDKDPIVRQACLDALAERDDPKTIELLARNLEDKVYAVRYRTAATIIHLSAKRAGRK